MAVQGVHSARQSLEHLIHFPLVAGDTGPEVLRYQQWFNRQYAFYAPPVTGTYGSADEAAVTELQRRLGLTQTGHFNIQTAKKAGYIQTPVFFSVEGHSSDMFAGPVADTAAQLEAEGLCHHEPTNYNNGAIPFDNQSGVDELARRVGQTVQDNGISTPPGTPIIIGGFSQGMIVVYDFLAQHFGPGCDLEWRKDDVLGYLFYGNPCRAANSGGSDGTHGLDPLKRFNLPGCVPQPANVHEVWRPGDIFAQNGDDEASQLKAAVYQLVARGDFISQPFSIFAKLEKIATDFAVLLPEVIAIFQAIISGISFLADNPNPHYGPFDIGGGLDWARNLLS